MIACARGPSGITRRLPRQQFLWVAGRNSQLGSPGEMSQPRIDRSSSVRQPVRSWIRTIAATAAGRNGRVASTSATSTGLTASGSLAWCPPLPQRLNTLKRLVDLGRDQFMTDCPLEDAANPVDPRLIVVRPSPCLTISAWTARKQSGPKSATSVVP